MCLTLDRSEIEKRLRCKVTQNLCDAGPWQPVATLGSDIDVNPGHLGATLELASLGPCTDDLALLFGETEVLELHVPDLATTSFKVGSCSTCRGSTDGWLHDKRAQAFGKLWEHGEAAKSGVVCTRLPFPMKTDESLANPTLARQQSPCSCGRFGAKQGFAVGVSYVGRDVSG